jgi:hypothetical protein
MVGDIVGGLLRVLGATAFGAILIGGVLYGRELAAMTVRLCRRLHLLPAPAPNPQGLPVERIARDLRRLQPEARRPQSGTTNAKHRGVVAAYDDLLLEACRAVDVSTSLSELPEGLERESERLRVEYELEKAGISLRTVS